MRKPKERLAFLTAVLLATTSLNATGIIRHDRDAADYDALGREASFESTCRYLPNYREPDKSACAVLIAPQWAVTAAHVICRGGEVITKDQRLVANSEVYRIAEFKFHPEFDRTAPSMQIKASGCDLALLRLDRPVRRVAPAVRYRGDSEVGRQVTMVGHGIGGDGKQGPIKPFTATRRGGHNMIDVAGGSFGRFTVSKRLLLFDVDDPTSARLNVLGSPDPLTLEAGGSPGDSGGGWYLHEDGNWFLVAIESGFIPREGKADEETSPCRYGSIGAGMRISTANTWIDAAINGAVKR